MSNMLHSIDRNDRKKHIMEDYIKEELETLVKHLAFGDGIHAANQFQLENNFELVKQ